MKKYIVVLLSLICAVMLTACGKNLDNIPSFSVIEEQGDTWATERLIGYTKDNLREIWGEPDSFLSGLYGEIWSVENDYDLVIAYYDENDKVTDVKYVSAFKAIILEVKENSLLVEPCEGEWERSSADQIFVGIGHLEMAEEIKAEFAVGKTVLVKYNGAIDETYPAQLSAMYGVELLEENK